MRISSGIVGREITPDRQQVDRRWLMAYSAGLGERDYPHPLFAVAYEWPATRKLRERAGLADIDARLVHAQHDLVLHRMARPGDLLQVSGQVVAARQKRPGVLVVFRFTTRDAQGELVSTTDFTALYRGVELEGGERALAEVADPPAPVVKLEPVGDIPVAATAAHVYTECARIWNPIHTDVEYAKAAGLPDIILHGTATLALSVSKVIQDLKLVVHRVRCRFAGMVTMPCTLQVHAARAGEEIAFETRNERGQTVIERGWIG